MRRLAPWVIAAALLIAVTGCSGTVRDFSPREATQAPSADDATTGDAPEGGDAAPVAGDYTSSWCPLDLATVTVTLGASTGTVLYADWTAEEPSIAKRNCTYTLTPAARGAESVVIWSALEPGLIGLPPSAAKAPGLEWTARGRAVTGDSGGAGYVVSWKQDSYYFSVETAGAAGTTADDARTAAVALADRMHGLTFVEGYWTHR